MNRSGTSALEKPVSGLVSAQVSLRGTADDPRLQLAVEGTQTPVKQLAPSDIDVSRWRAQPAGGSGRAQTWRWRGRRASSR